MNNFAYELYYYDNTPETVAAVGPIVETVRVYRNGGKKVITNVGGDIVWSTHTSDGRVMNHGSITTTRTGIVSDWVAEPVDGVRIASAYWVRDKLNDELWEDLTRV